jgi:hypothetical protein
LAAFLDFEASCKYPKATHEIYVEGKTIVARRLPRVA